MNGKTDTRHEESKSASKHETHATCHNGLARAAFHDTLDLICVSAYVNLKCRTIIQYN